MKLEELKKAFRYQLESTHPLSVASAVKALEIAKRNGDPELIMLCQEHVDERIGQQVLFYIANGLVWKVWGPDLSWLAEVTAEVAQWPDPKYTVPHLKVIDDHPVS